MNYEILECGDRVLNVTDKFLAVEREDGTVVLYALEVKGNSVFLNTENPTTIGYSGDDCPEPEEILSGAGLTVTVF